jgi:inhibitor of KinA
MQIQPFGEKALIINFEQIISPEINDSVLHLTDAIQAQAWPAITYLIPAYCSLTLGFHPRLTTYAQLKQAIVDLWEQLDLQQAHTPKRQIEIPVSYHATHALDRELVLSTTGLTWPEVVQLHSGRTYRVYMMGFLPGFPYLGKLPDQLEVSRLPIPRKRVPPLSVGLAGLQTGIYPFEAPGGWLIMGKAACPIFEPDQPSPFLLNPGDEVVFKPVDW